MADAILLSKPNRFFASIALTGPPAYFDEAWWVCQGPQTTLVAFHPDESKGMLFGPWGASALSSPCPGTDGHLYFQGTLAADGQTSKLIKMAPRSGLTWALGASLGPTNCVATPLAPLDGSVYFLTDGNKLMRVNPTVAPAAATDYEDIVCATTPVVPKVGSVRTMFYSEADGTIRRIGLFETGRTPGAAELVCEEKTTQPLLACVDGYLYFETGKTLYRHAMDGSGTSNHVTLPHSVKGGVKAFDFPFDKRVYYLADDGYLYSQVVDPWPATAAPVKLCETKMASAPCPGPPGWLGCEGADHNLYKLATT